MRSRFPTLRPGDEFEALYEHRAGVLLVECCVEAHLEQAARSGAELRFETPVEGWEATDGGVRLTAADGEVEADGLVLAAGPWNPSLVAGAGVPLVVERQVMHWFASPSAGSASSGGNDAPISVWEPAEGPHFYSLPDLGGWGPSAKGIHFSATRWIASSSTVPPTLGPVSSQRPGRRWASALPIAP